MNVFIAIFSLLGGYFIGSISFARIITRIFSPDTDITVTHAPIEGSEQTLRMEAVSATSVRVQLGSKFGCLTSILDMGKIFVPVLALKMLYPDSPYYVMAATTGVIGHDWPIYYKFKGGYGHSPTYGALLVIDWMAVVVSLVTSLLVGAVIRHLYLAMAVSFWVLIPWLWFRFHDGWILTYAIVINLAYIIKLLPDFKQVSRIQKEDRSGEA
jgi:glycerol-3-phosphate acyltransferase PlsY